MDEFDLEAVYDAEIAPLMAQIIDICKKHNLPMCAEFLYKNDDEEGEQYCTSYVGVPKAVGVSDHMEELWKIIQPRRSAPPLDLTVRNADGTVTQMIRILP